MLQICLGVLNFRSILIAAEKDRGRGFRGVECIAAVRAEFHKFLCFKHDAVHLAVAEAP